MRRQKAKGKRQRAKSAAPAALPLPESRTLAEAAPHEQSRVDAARTIDSSDSSAAPAAESAAATHASSTSYDRATQFVARRGALLVVIIAAFLSAASFAYFFANGMTNHYGDGIAHVNIARKVVDSPDDSLWQRYLQIGTPWLPLQTVLMLPLVAVDGLWRSGAAGSLVSMIAFVIAAAMISRVARHLPARRSAAGLGEDFHRPPARFAAVDGDSYGRVQRARWSFAGRRRLCDIRHFEVEEASPE